ncbi:MAG: tRNA (N6-isopentenyl adenosine(37)-C2)-methylthiotransferase MiaB [Elusimicrobiota bacterium]
MKLHTISLGCQMSAADAQEMSAPIESLGFSRAAAPDDADVILISTCTVRQHAEDRAMSLIGSLRRWKEKDRNRVLIIGGCAAERAGDAIRSKFPHVDLVVGAKSVDQFPELIRRALNARFDAMLEQGRAFSPETSPLPPPASAASSYLTIMRGCNYSCSYCIVPSVRGREIYRSAEDILQEARIKTAAGAREIMLLGQTVNSYSNVYHGEKIRFADLLRLLDAIPGLQRLRFMSPHPYYVDAPMIEAMATTRSVCEHLHLPAQSGSDRILKLMRRNYTRETFLAKAAHARAAVPDLVISTDIIVGFPTETEEDFQATLDFLEEFRPVSAYCFKYSPREGTESASWPDDIPVKTKEDRLSRLNHIMDRMTQDSLKAQIGKTVEVLCDEPGFGRTRQGFKVKWVDAEPMPGNLTRISIIGAAKRVLLGEKI